MVSLQRIQGMNDKDICDGCGIGLCPYCNRLEYGSTHECPTTAEVKVTDYLDELDELYEKATKAPWRPGYCIDGVFAKERAVTDVWALADENSICALHNNFERMRDEIRQLRSFVMPSPDTPEVELTVSSAEALLARVEMKKELQEIAELDEEFHNTRILIEQKEKELADMFIQALDSRKSKNMRSRREKLAELTRLTQEYGGYDDQDVVVKLVEIIVNGDKHAVVSGSMTYEQISAIAAPGYKGLLTMTCKTPGKDGWIVCTGDSFIVEEGMIFSAFDTSNA